MTKKFAVRDHDWRGLEGRLMNLPAPKGKKSKILIVYGQHSSLERCAGIAEALNIYGEVFMPDMPGFGGMDSFYKLDKKPSVDLYADYLKDFIEKEIEDGPIIIVGISYGFANVTRMLQKYPELQKRVKMLVSFVGFTGSRDFQIQHWYVRHAGRIAATYSRGPVGASIFKGFMSTGVFEMYYKRQIPKTSPYNKEAKQLRNEEVKRRMHLWKVNDHRTHAETAYEFVYHLDLRGIKVPMTVHHMGVDYDHFFDHKKVVAHMREIYSKVENYNLAIGNHSPSEDADVEEIRRMIPGKLTDKISKMP